MQLQTLTEQLRRNRKVQHQYYQNDTIGIIVLNEEDYEQPFVHIPRWRREVWPCSYDGPTKGTKTELRINL